MAAFRSNYCMNPQCAVYGCLIGEVKNFPKQSFAVGHRTLPEPFCPKMILIGHMGFQRGGWTSIIPS
jgi:hypothetical protein